MEDGIITSEEFWYREDVPGQLYLQAGGVVPLHPIIQEPPEQDQKTRSVLFLCL